MVTVGALKVLNKVNSTVGGLAVLAYEEVGPAGSGIKRSIFVDAVMSQGSYNRLKVGINIISIVVILVCIRGQICVVGSGDRKSVV